MATMMHQLGLMPQQRAAEQGHFAADSR
jgi:hypothetical protein